MKQRENDEKLKSLVNYIVFCWKENVLLRGHPNEKVNQATVVCLFVSYLFRAGHSTDMCSLLQENLLRGKKESVSRSYVHVC